MGLTSIPSHHIRCDGHRRRLLGAKCEVGATTRNPFFRELLREIKNMLHATGPSMRAEKEYCSLLTVPLGVV
jgi:hypothetical protein